MRVEQKDLVPPMIISGNQFTMISQHQVAAREYLEAYKQMPDSSLINLCAGMFYIMIFGLDQCVLVFIFHISLLLFFSLQGLPW